MGVVDEPVEDGVGIGWTADHLVPRRNRQLAGDDRRSAAIALLEDFEEVVAGMGVERFKPPVVKDQELDTAELRQDAGIASVAAGQCQAGDSLGTR